MRLRLPWWLSGRAEISINGEPLAVDQDPSSYVEIHRTWTDDAIHLVFPKSLVAVPLPDDEEMVGFMDGPVVLAGLIRGSNLPPRKQKRPATKMPAPTTGSAGSLCAGTRRCPSPS